MLARYCPEREARAGEIERRPDWYRKSLARLGREIMHGINRACVINPVNAVATILLATPRQSIEIEELIAQSELHRRLIEGVPSLASIRVEGRIDRKRIERMQRHKLLHIREHELGDIVYLEPRDAVKIGYYRNNSLHALIVPALIACCFTNLRRTSRASILRRVRLLYPFLKSELQLEWRDRSLTALIDECLACLVAQDLLERADDEFRRPPRSDRAFVRLTRLGQVIQPILERYYMTFIVLWQTSGAPLGEAEVERRCHLLAQRISMIYGINSPDFFDRPLFRDFIQTMLERGYLLRNRDRQLEFAEGFDYVSLDLRNLLSTDVRGSILALINASPHEPDEKPREPGH